MDLQSLTQSLDVDVRAKYAQESALRRQNGGISQYRQAREPDLVHYLEDKNSKVECRRDPISASYSVVIVGGGYAGLIVAVQLLKRGIKDFAILEQGSDFGGTWYWNRYPGAQCDVESYIYMPFLEETNYVPTEKYAHAPELEAQAQKVGRHFDLYSKTIFQTSVRNLRWEDSSSTWKVETNRNDRISASWVIPCPGNQSMPKLPGVAGVGSFLGKSFHTSRWDYDYTGGETDGRLHKLSGRRVGVIGTGASAVQVVPELSKWASRLFVFQRTPSSISMRNNRPTDTKWSSALEPGWQRRRMDNFHALTTGTAELDAEDMVNDAWTELLSAVAGGVPRDEGRGGKPTPDEAPPSVEDLALRMELADLKIMDGIRARVDREVAQNPEAAAALKPWYNLLCKRPCFHDEYLATFNRDNVRLVDLKGKGVDALTKEGVVANGELIELDCIVYATGFEWQTQWTQRTGMEIYGREGVKITDKWSEGMSTFHGWGVAGFPNLALVTHAQSGLAVNYTHCVLEKAEHIAYVIATCMHRGVQAAQPTVEAEKSWVRECLDLGGPRKEFLSQCIPGYFNHEGEMSDKAVRSDMYGGGPIAYQRILTNWRAANKLEGLALEP